MIIAIESRFSQYLRLFLALENTISSDFASMVDNPKQYEKHCKKTGRDERK
jgi:hypothetical protein